MPAGPNPPGGPPGSSGNPGGKRPAIGLQIKLPCASMADVKSRYGEELRQGRFFIRTKSPRPADTLVRLEAQLSGGEVAFRAAAVVARAVEPVLGGPEPGMALQLLAVDDAGRDLIASLGGRPPPPLKADPVRPAPPSPPPRPSIMSMPGIKPPPPPAPPKETTTTPPPPSAAAAPAAERPAAKKGPMIGIDLGTTNSCAAVVKDGKPFVIPSREGYNTIPSIVAVNERGKVIVGHPAKGQLLINPRNTVYGAKRLVGRAFTSPVVTDLIGRFPYQIVAGPRGEAAVQLGEQQISLQQVSALVLAEVKQIAEQWLRTDVTRAVVTVPAYYNDNQRHAVREAGELAGLEVERIVNEPTAAALAFGHGKRLEQQRLFVYDLGGGTFDAAVLQLNGNVYEVVSTGGDTFLGGVDFDKAIVDHLLGLFKDKNGIDFPGDRVALQRVTDAAERAKIALSERVEYKLRVPFVALVGQKPYDLEATITRPELVTLTAHLIDRTLAVCGEVLEARGLKPSDVDEVLLVGGQSRMPLVRERVRSWFGREPSKAVHPDEAVALGAALVAHSIDAGDGQGVVLLDVLPMSIGVGLPGGRFRKIVERNTALPHRKSLGISTTREDQESLEIAIFQGENSKAQENEYLGTLVIPRLPKGPRGSQSFEIVFSLSAESILTVIAQQEHTGRKVSATFSTRDTPEEVKKRLADSPVEDTRLPQPNGKPAGGFFGWLKRLFGASPQPRV